VRHAEPDHALSRNRRPIPETTETKSLLVFMGFPFDAVSVLEQGCGGNLA
jgi:hypothetical protein